MNILLFGKGGQLGWELQRSLAPLGELTALDVDSREHCGDLSNLDGLRQTIRTLCPDIIVNAAAHTAVDKAESEPDLAHLLNATAPGLMAEEAQRRKAWLVHYSTDYVFDGSGQRPWREDDPAQPLNVYGRSKLAGEQAIRASACQHLILRTSWVYAARGNNFARTILRLAQEKEQLSVIADQIGAPTGADLLADITAHALSMALRNPALGGLYHAVAAGETSWHGYADLVIQFARSAGVSMRLGHDRILPVASCDYPQPAVRPRNSRMSTEKLQAAFGLHLPPWQQGLIRMLTEIMGPHA